jgi:hypothetical protein
MEGELWRTLYRIVWEFGKTCRSGGVQFSNTWIALVFFWAVLHDRPVRWACDPMNWPREMAGRRLPSAPTMTRRLRRPILTILLHRIETRLRESLGTSWCKFIDAMPLPVGGSTMDPDARCGRAARIMAKGYKFYAIYDARGGVTTWAVEPMNRAEVKVAETLIDQLDGEGYLVGDGEYDSMKLYDRCADKSYQLVSPKRAGTGLGHVRQSPNRLRSLELLSRPFGQSLLRARYDIDRRFGQWGNFSAGLKPLPHWVRRLPRVRRWIQGKIIIEQIRRLKKQGLAA